MVEEAIPPSNERSDGMKNIFGLVAGLALLFPANAIPHGIWTDIDGLALGVAIVLREVMAMRGLRQARTQASSTL